MNHCFNEIMGIEMKQEFGLERLPKKQYQVVEINGIKFDYFDFDLAKQAVSGEILNIQEILRQNPTLSGAKKVNGLLHTLEEKLTYVLEKMERPPEDEIRPAGPGILYIPDKKD